VRIAFWVIAAAVIVLDQWTKHVVQVSLPLNGPSTPVVPGLLYLTYVHNLGSAFGQLQGSGPLLVIAALVAVFGILSYRARLLRKSAPPHPLLVWGLALPLGGAIGNMLDRAFLGHVVDFLDLRVWPIFNVADSAISLGACALALFFLVVSKPAEPAPERAAPTRECSGEHGA
jgi:signal peptidase II